MDIFKKIDELRLPKGKYALFGSAIMAIRNIREARDLDVLVTKGVYDQLKQEGWSERKVKEGVVILEKDGVDVSCDASCNGYKPNTEELITSAEMINNLPFVKIEELIKFKLAKNTDRDLNDVKQIEDYLKLRNSC